MGNGGFGLVCSGNFGTADYTDEMDFADFTFANQVKMGVAAGFINEEMKWWFCVDDPFKNRNKTEAGGLLTGLGKGSHRLPEYRKAKVVLR